MKKIFKAKTRFTLILVACLASMALASCSSATNQPEETPSVTNLSVKITDEPTIKNLGNSPFKSDVESNDEDWQEVEESNVISEEELEIESSSEELSSVESVEEVSLEESIGSEFGVSKDISSVESSSIESSIIENSYQFDPEKKYRLRDAVAYGKLLVNKDVVVEGLNGYLEKDHFVCILAYDNNSYIVYYYGFYLEIPMDEVELMDNDFEANFSKENWIGIFA